MSFTINGTTLADVEIKGISGQPALGFHRLIVNVELDFFPMPQNQGSIIVELTGELMLRRADNNASHYVGRLQPMQGPVLMEVREMTRHMHKSLEVELNHSQLEAIESIRLGGDLMLNATLYARAQLGSEGHILQAQLSYRVNQGTWVEILGQLGYARTMLLEVPVPDESSPEMMDVVSHLARAHQAMVRGNYREAVGCCRDVLESLSVALGDRDDQDPEVQGLFANTRQMDKAARLRVVRRAVKILSHPARHADESAARTDWERVDATSMVSMVSALVQLAAKTT